MLCENQKGKARERGVARTRTATAGAPRSGRLRAGLFAERLPNRRDPPPTPTGLSEQRCPPGTPHRRLPRYCTPVLSIRIALSRYPSDNWPQAQPQEQGTLQTRPHRKHQGL